jgi:hypothetical protein
MHNHSIAFIAFTLIGAVLAQQMPHHLARQIESVQPKRQEIIYAPICDPTLSFVEIYYTFPGTPTSFTSPRQSNVFLIGCQGHPELGGSMFTYQQIDCSTYNRSLYFLQNEHPIYASSALTTVALPETSGSYAGTAWSESIRMELSVDPLDWTRERWFWSADGLSLIHETTFDHMSLRRTANGTIESYTWHSESEIWSSLSSTLVLKRFAGFTRNYQVPAPVGVAPQDAVKLDSRFETLKLNKTSSMSSKF